MNLATTIEIYAGGPGSGCAGPNCGRKPAGEIKELLKEHDAIKGHPLRLGIQQDRIYRMQAIRLPALVDRMASIFTAKQLTWVRTILGDAETEYSRGHVEEATILQETVLSTLHTMLVVSLGK